MQRRLVLLHRQHVVRFGITMASAISVWQPMASMVTKEPEISRI